MVSLAFALFYGISVVNGAVLYTFSQGTPLRTATSGAGAKRIPEFVRPVVKRILQCKSLEPDILAKTIKAYRMDEPQEQPKTISSRKQRKDKKLPIPSDSVFLEPIERANEVVLWRISHLERHVPVDDVWDDAVYRGLGQLRNSGYKYAIDAWDQRDIVGYGYPGMFSKEPSFSRYNSSVRYADVPFDSCQALTELLRLDGIEKVEPRDSEMAEPQRHLFGVTLPHQEGIYEPIYYRINAGGLWGSKQGLMELETYPNVGFSSVEQAIKWMNRKGSQRDDAPYHFFCGFFHVSQRARTSINSYFDGTKDLERKKAQVLRLADWSADIASAIFEQLNHLKIPSKYSNSVQKFKQSYSESFKLFDEFLVSLDNTQSIEEYSIAAMVLENYFVCLAKHLGRLKRAGHASQDKYAMRTFIYELEELTRTIPLLEKILNEKMVEQPAKDRKGFDFVFFRDD